MTPRIHFFITVNFLLAAASCIAMNQSNQNNNNIIKKPIFCFFPDNERVFIGGRRGQGIFDIKSKKLTTQNCKQTDPTKLVNSYAAHKNSLVIVYNNSEQTAHIFNMNEGRYTFNDCFRLHHPNNTIAINNNRIFSHDKTDLSSYDYSNGTLATVKILRDVASFDYPGISCHSTKNELIYSNIPNKLSIIQPGRKPLIKTTLSCTGPGIRYGEYNPNGTVIAIRRWHTQWCASAYYYIYNIDRNDDYAVKLETKEKNHIELAFAPYSYLLALLSHDGIVQYWDYKSLNLVATTQILIKNFDNEMYHRAKGSKRLAFSPDGMHLAIALKDKWCIIDVPQNNLFAIFAMLKENNLLQELIQLILQNIIVDGAALSHLNFAELSHIAPLPEPPPEQEDAPQQETEEKTIRLIKHNEWKKLSEQKQ